MAEILGIGGLFIRTRDPESMAKWYGDHLGIPVNGLPWEQQAGPTVMAAFPEDTEYFDRPEQAFMLNLRVSDLDGLVARLKEEGLEVIRRDDWDNEYGRFARIHDPEGNPIELWEPPPG